MSHEAMINFHVTFPQMVKYKQAIQREIILQLDKKELDDIRYSRLNETVINKLVRIGHNYYRRETNKLTLYSLAMAIGTIIKEYEWGTYYISQYGMYQLAIKIVESN